MSAIGRDDMAPQSIKMNRIEKLRRALLFGLVVTLAAFSGAGASRAENATTERSPGAVYLFSGMVWPIFDSTHGTGVEEMMQRIRAFGVQAEVGAPGDWERAADAFLASGRTSTPVAVVGYSFGANAAILFSRRLERANVPVQTLVVIEAAKPPQIPTNVRRAVHYYVSGMADRIAPAPGFSGSIENINLGSVDPDAASRNHWSVSHLELLHSKVIAEVLDGDRVRVRGEASNGARQANAGKPARRPTGELVR
jgi:pimeloyl-ACP methyl ester carboxylesterase